MKYFRRMPILFIRRSGIFLKKYSKNNWVYSYLNDMLITKIPKRGQIGYSQTKYNQSDSL